MKIIGIYKITSPSGKVYIGQSWNIRNRWKEYKRTLAFSQPKLHSSLKKYGFHEHSLSVIHELPSDVSQEVMDNYERLYMELYTSCGIELLNIREGGSTGKLDKETIKKIVEKRRANGSYEVKEHVRKLTSERQKGKPLPITKEHILKTAEKLRGRKQPDWHKEKNRQAQLGRKHSEETKEKIRQSKIGRNRPDIKLKWEEHKKNNPKLIPEKKPREYKPMKLHVKEALRDAAMKRRGIPQTEAHKQARSIAIKEWWQKRKQQLQISYE